MADENYFLSENYVYKPGITVTSSYAFLEDYIYDYDLTTAWQSANPPNSPCYIEVTLDSAYDIDAFWIKGSNIDEVGISRWTGAWTPVASLNPDANNIIFHVHAISYTEDQWQFVFTPDNPANIVYCYELMIMKHLKTQKVSDDSWSSNIIITPVDRIGGSYPLADGSESSYRGIKIYHDITFEYEFTPQANRDDLYDLYYSTDYGIRPNIVIYPLPDEYPEGIYRVMWESIDFPFNYTIPYRGSGFSGTLNFKEY